MADDEWESVWREYDRRAPTSPPAAPAAPKARARRPSPLVLLALGLSLALAPRLASLQANMAGGIDRPPVAASLSPAEAELPPLSASVARLAAHSADAACWVMRLDPRQPACP
jgi:hypothetical protein